MLIKGIFIFILMVMLVSYFIHKIIYISFEKGLFDEPTEDRKIHLKGTPNLGGVAIFVSMLISSILIFSWTSLPHINIIFFSALIVFIIGVADDISGINPSKKMAAQVFVSLLIALFTDFRITDLSGLFGIREIPFSLSVILTTLFIIFLINAFNLIDGINCLAGSVGLLVSLFFTVYFWQVDDHIFMLLSVAMCGCLGSFLLYNRTPAKIFMGDTGSLFIGFMTALLSIRFLESNNRNALQNPSVFFPYAPAMLVSFLIVPLYDTCRVFILRILKSKSPFTADRNHIHHLLINLGYTHMAATGILLGVTVIMVAFVFVLRSFSLEVIFSFIVAFTSTLNYILYKKHISNLKSNRKTRTTSPAPTLKIIRGIMDVERF